MSSFPAMISNEPPPIESDQDDDDEFGDEFRSNGLRLDVSADPSPMCSPRKPPLLDSNSNTNIQKVSPLAISSTPLETTLVNGGSRLGPDSPETTTVCPSPGLDQEEDFGDFTLSAANNGFDTDLFPADCATDIVQPIHPIVNGTCSNPDESTPSEILEVEAEDWQFQSSESDFRILPEVNDEDLQLHGSEFKLPEVDEEDLECAEFTLSEPEQAGEPQGPEFNIAEAVEEDDDDFGDFTTSDANVSLPLPPPTISVNQSGFQSSLTYSIDRDSKTFEVQPEPLNLTSEFDDDDFGDFASTSAKDSESNENVTPPSLPVTFPTPQLQRRESLPLEGRLDALIKSVFNHPSTPSFSLPSDLTASCHLETIDVQLGNRASNATWTHVQEFEDSNCLVHKWPRSAVHHLLLKSLNIDYSNMMYSAKYGAIQVPKFASSLVDSPLQPESIALRPHNFDYHPSIDEGMRIERLDDDSPDTPIEESTTSTSSTSTLNKETIRILEQLPDLSYMLAKTLVFPRHPNY